MNEFAVNELTEAEQQFLYNSEVLKMTQQRAAELAGVSSPGAVLKKPSVIIAREKIRQSLRARVDITKEDVLTGIQKAIFQADLLSDPMAQIAGWREISKMLGYDAPREIKITINGAVKDVRKQIAQLGDEELVELLGADDVIDAEFYQVGHGG